MSLVDERIVKMVFDNSSFQDKVGETIKSITQLNQETDDMASHTTTIGAMGKAFEQCELLATKAGFHIQDVWVKLTSILEYQVARRILNVSKDIANALSFKGVKDGFAEYELKMGSIQTIMAGTGESLAKVNAYLDELNTYSDKTIYSFADMTNNIGKFTNAGVKLKDAVAAIKGIANEAAISGANANEASRAMYNFSQALSAGYVKLIDWKSIENANMATKGFKDALLEVATAVGTVEKTSDGMYKVLSKNAQGASMKEVMSATKNFNDSLSYQWMTTDVLTKTLHIYATSVDDLTEAEKRQYEQELRNMGMSDEQIKYFEELGVKATKAASEVKTFTMLLDTLKEAVQSGWAQSVQIVIGDFEEAKKLWTDVNNVVSAFIDKQAETRNEMLQTWKDLEGRTTLITALRNIFKSLSNILTPISQQFKKLFPPMTGERLNELTQNLWSFSTNLLNISNQVAPKFVRVANGAFSVLDIGLQIVKQFVSAISPLGPVVKGVASALLNFAAGLGDFLVAIDKIITRSRVFETVFSAILSVVMQPVIFIMKHIDVVLAIIDAVVAAVKFAYTVVSTVIKSIVSLVASLITGIKSVKEPIEETEEPVNAVAEALRKFTEWIDALREKLGGTHPVLEAFKKIFQTIGSVVGKTAQKLGDIFTKVFSTIGGGNVTSGVFNTILTIFTGGLLIKLKNGIKVFEEFGDVIGQFKDTLESFQKKIDAENLKAIATSVGILAGSLVVVASIDSEKLLGATAALGTTVGILVGAMAALMAAVNAFSTAKVSKAFKIFGKEVLSKDSAAMLKMAVTLSEIAKVCIALGTSVLELALALKIVASVAEDGHLWSSWAVVSLLLGELAGVGLLLSKFGGDKSVKGLLSMAVALMGVAEAIKIVADIGGGTNLWESWLVVTLILVELTDVALLIEKFGKYELGGMTGLISLTVSLNIAVKALKTVSDALGQDGQHIWQALGIISIIMAELGAVAFVLGKFGGGARAVTGAIGMLGIAGALMMVIDPLLEIEAAVRKGGQGMLSAVIFLGLVLGELVVATMLLSQPGSLFSIAGALSIVATAGALVILTESLSKIAEMLRNNPLSTWAALGYIFVALLDLAVGLTAMIAALPGAAALIVASAALVTLAGALAVFGDFSPKEMGLALDNIAKALIVFIALGTPISLVSPLLLSFAVALGAAGAAMLVFAAGAVALGTGAEPLIDAFNKLLLAVVGIIPELCKALMEGIVEICKVIRDSGPTIGQAAVVAFRVVLKALVEAAEDFGMAAVTLVAKFLEVIGKAIPIIAKAGASIIVGFFEGFAVAVPYLVDGVYKAIIKTFTGIADAIVEHTDLLIAATNYLMAAILYAVEAYVLNMPIIGALIPQGLKDGILGGQREAIDAVKQTMDEINAEMERKAQESLEIAEEESAKAAGILDENGQDVVNSVDKTGKDVNASVDKNSKEANKTAKSQFDDMKKGVANALKGLVGDTKGSLGDLAGAFTDFSNKDFDMTKVLDLFGVELDESSLKMLEFSRTAQKAGRNLDVLKGKIRFVGDEVVSVGNGFQELSTEIKKNTDDTEENTKAQDALGSSSGATKKKLREQADVMEYAGGVVQAFADTYGHLYSNLGNVTSIDVAKAAIKKLAEETYLASVKTKDAVTNTEEAVDHIENMIKSFTELKESIASSVKSVFSGDSMFSQFEAKTEKTMDELLVAMQSNVNGVASWTQKLAALGERGISQGLLRQLAELGPKGYEYINAFSNATAEQIQQANQLFADSAAVQGYAENTVVASYALAGVNAAQGFIDGIDQNIAGAATKAQELGLTTLTYLKQILDEHSPSKKTYQYGKWLDEGLRNGITDGTGNVISSVVSLSFRIISMFTEILTPQRFYKIAEDAGKALAEGFRSEEVNVAMRNSYMRMYDYGSMIGGGLASGLRSQADNVRAAAKELSDAAANTTKKENEINSPSKRYRRFGAFIGEGLALGLTDEIDTVEDSAYIMSEALRSALIKAQTIAEDEMNLQPVITPVLDMSKVEDKVGLIGSLFPNQTLKMASTIGVGQAPVSTGNTDGATVVPGSINFTQNNYSPKALDRYEIYRQTKNQVAMLKGALA